MTMGRRTKGNTPAGNGTFSQRYCVYEGFTKGQSPTGVMFYTGNEAPVEEYVNNTGLMWTLGEELGSLIVFAEHRCAQPHRASIRLPKSALRCSCVPCSALLLVFLCQLVRPVAHKHNSLDLAVGQRSLQPFELVACHNPAIIAMQCVRTVISPTHTPPSHKARLSHRQPLTHQPLINHAPRTTHRRHHHHQHQKDTRATLFQTQTGSRTA